MAWIDFKKAFDMVPHSCILQSMGMLGVAKNMIGLLQNSMKKWKTELTAAIELLGEMNIKRGIFQGDNAVCYPYCL